MASGLLHEASNFETLWEGGPRLREGPEAFRVGTDSVLLANFSKSIHPNRKKRMIDLGCGSGLISIILAWEDPNMLVDGVEIRPDSARLAMENAKLNGLSDRIKIIEGDLRHHREFLQAGTYDLAVSNPPYYAADGGVRPQDPGSAAARCDELCTTDDVCKAAGFLTRFGGSFTMVNKPDSLATIFAALRDNGLEPKRIRFVQHKWSSPPCLVLIESRRGAKPPLKVEAPLILTDGDGAPSDEMAAILKLKSPAD